MLAPPTAASQFSLFLVYISRLLSMRFVTSASVAFTNGPICEPNLDRAEEDRFFEEDRFVLIYLDIYNPALL